MNEEKMESQNTPFPVPSQQEYAQKLSKEINTSPAPASNSEQSAQVITFPSQAEASAQLPKNEAATEQGQPQAAASSPESNGNQQAA